MLAIVVEPAVDLVADNDEIVFDGDPGDCLTVLAPEHASGRILWRVHDQQAGARRDQRAQLFGVGPEVVALPHRKRNRSRADELHQRAIDGISRIRDDHLVARLHQRQEREQQQVLASRRQHDVLHARGHSRRACHVAGGRLPNLGDAARRGVVRRAILDRAHRRIGDVLRCGEVRLTDLQMDDLPSLCLEAARVRQHLESALGAETRHALGEMDGHAITGNGGRSPTAG